MQFFTIFFLSALLVLAAVAAEEEKPWWLNQEFIDAVTFERNSGNEVIETAKAYGPFSLVAIRPGSPIHLQPINAHEYGFWIGKPTTSKCTLETKSYCPKGDKTLLELIQYSKTDTKLYMCRFLKKIKFSFFLPPGLFSLSRSPPLYFPPFSSN